MCLRWKDSPREDDLDSDVVMSGGAVLWADPPEQVVSLEKYHGPSRPLLPDTQEVAQAGWKNTCSSYFSYLHDPKPDGTAEGQEAAFQLRVSMS